MRPPGNLISLVSVIAALLLSSPVDPGAALEQRPAPVSTDVELGQPAIPLAMLAE